MAATSPMRYCTQCHRAGDKLATCGSFMLCPGGKDPQSPNFPEVDFSKSIVVSCDECKQSVCLPIFDILIGAVRVDFRCQRAEASCQARVVQAPPPPSSTKRAPSK
jgi:hypothetical protein